MSESHSYDHSCTNSCVEGHLKKVLIAENGSTWVVFNAHHLPQRRSSIVGTMKDGLVPRFYNEDYPYLCAMLDPCALSGRFLGTFRFLDVMQTRGRYSLAPSQIMEWERHEAFAHKLIEKLLPSVTTTLDFSLPILPFRLGYAGTDETEANVRSRARRSRLAFCFLFGMLSYLIALEPRWMAVGIRAGLPEEWMKGLETSPIANFRSSEGRIGAFLDFSQSVAEIRNLPALIRKRIPFWIFWGDGTSYRPPLKEGFQIRIAELLKPKLDQVMRAKAEKAGCEGNVNSAQPDVNDLFSWDFDHELPVNMSNTKQSPKNTSSAIPSASHTPLPRVDSLLSDPTTRLKNTLDALRSAATNFLPVEPYSGFVSFQPGQLEKGSRQLPFEMPEQFWARQHAEDEKNLDNMSESERKRLRNERDGRRITKKAKVFHWERTSCGFVRRRVSQKEFEDYSEYPPTQMRFSVTRNEWDVCSDFGPDSDEYLLDSDSEGSCEFPKIRVAEKKEPPSLSGREIPDERRSDSSEDGEIQTSDRILMHVNAISPDVAILLEKRFHEALKCRYTIRNEVKVKETDNVALDKMLYYRYGISRRSNNLLVTSGQGVTQSAAETGWATTRGIFYDVESSVDSFSLSEMLDITEFVKLLLENRPVPSAILDIHPHNYRSAFAKEMRHVFRSLNIQKVLFDRNAYLLRPDYLDFAIAFEDPSLVVEVLRRAVSSIRGQFDVLAIIKQFAERGSPFRTLRFVKEPGINMEAMSWDLGYRTLAEEPGAFTYAQYERMLQAFMRQPRARRVFGIGGPIWRAVLEACGFNADAELSPSEDVCTFGRNFTLPDNRILWEDALTDSDVLFLCGTYKVRKGNDTMLYSWWPTAKQWEASTSNVRYWSPGNERWFMMRLHDIRDGRATWVHAPKWAQKLKTNKKTKRLMARNEELCEQFLDFGE